jgi:hypothetical protein
VEPTGTVTGATRFPITPASTGLLAMVVILAITVLAIGLIIHTRNLKK